MAGNAAGALKARAARAGVSVELLLEHERRNEFWCFRCRAFHFRSEFGDDRTRSDGRDRSCRESRNAVARRKYQPSVNPVFGPAPNPPRDGDRKQARQRVNVLVRTGKIPHPNSLPCVDCGHVWCEEERRHEYDHHLGYGAEHHLDVEAVCTTCHRSRADARGETEQTRGEHGRFIRAREVVKKGG